MFIVVGNSSQYTWDIWNQIFASSPWHLSSANHSIWWYLQSEAICWQWWHPLSQDIILCSVGVRYDNYCAALARTFLINPSLLQQKCYSALAEIELAVIKWLTPWSRARWCVWSSCRTADREGCLSGPSFHQGVRNRNWIGIPRVVVAYQSRKSRDCKAGMCFNVRLGVEGVANKVKETEVNVNELSTSACTKWYGDCGWSHRGRFRLCSYDKQSCCNCLLARSGQMCHLIWLMQWRMRKMMKQMQSKL